jgi:hypothetical protein
LKANKKSAKQNIEGGRKPIHDFAPHPHHFYDECFIAHIAPFHGREEAIFICNVLDDRPHFNVYLLFIWPTLKYGGKNVKISIKLGDQMKEENPLHIL